MDANNLKKLYSKKVLLEKDIENLKDQNADNKDKIKSIQKNIDACEKLIREELGL